MTNEKRKNEHLRISLHEPIDFNGVSTGFERYRFVHQALPEINLKDIKLSIKLLGKHLAAPYIISSMVGGIKDAGRINRNLALAARSLGLAMGVGSERCLIESQSSAKTYKVRDAAPDILLFANLGAVQLNYGFTVKDCRKAVEIIEADALILHLNPLQEALQPEGNTDFSGLLKKIAAVCRELPVPVIIKEVGCGLSAETARKLAEAGVAGIDVAGAGGTCWSEIERLRTTGEPEKRVAAHFADWGIPTADSLLMVRKAVPRLPVIASGGIRTGIDAAKAIALGADAVGIAAPLLKAANESSGAVEEYLKEAIEVLRIAMFNIGAAKVSDLKNTQFIYKF